MFKRALFNLQLSYQSHGATNNRNRSQLLNSLDAGSGPPERSLLSTPALSAWADNISGPTPESS